MSKTKQRRPSWMLPAFTLIFAAALSANIAFAQEARQLRTADGEAAKEQATQQQDAAAQASVDAVIAALVEATGSDHEDVQAAAYAGLANFLNDRPEIMQLFVEAAPSQEAKVREVVVYKLANMGATPSTEAVQALIKYGLTPGARTQTMMHVERALQKHYEISVPLLIAEMQSEAEADYRALIVSQLQRMEEKASTAVQPMLTILADQEEPPELRAEVATAVAIISKAHADASVAAAELADPAREQAKQMMKQMDTNGDGKVDVTELPVKGGDSQFFFRHMDADGDGFVTLEELMDVIGDPGR